MPFKKFENPRGSNKVIKRSKMIPFHLDICFVYVALALGAFYKSKRIT